MTHRIGTDTSQPKHADAIQFFNRLVLDLKLQHHGKPPHDPIDMDRLNEAGKHLRDLGQCREETRFYR